MCMKDMYFRMKKLNLQKCNKTHFNLFILAHSVDPAIVKFC